MAKQRKTAAIRRMSPELTALLSRKRVGPTKPVNRIGDQGQTVQFGIDTAFQLKLENWATGLLLKAGFYPAPEEQEEILVHPDMISDHGLQPLWHGTV